MNFRTTAAGRVDAETWFTELHDAGKTCASAGLDDVRRDLPAYAAAVAWNNLRVCGRLPVDEQQQFADLIDRSRKAPVPPGMPSPSLMDVVTYGTLKPRGLYEKYAEHVFAHGTGAKDAGAPLDEPRFEVLCSVAKLRPPSGTEHLDLRDPLDDILSQPNPIVWLAPYEDLKDCVQGATGLKEAMARVGVESRAAEAERRYLMMVKTAAVADDLRIASVADSTFYYLFGATDSGPYGMTRHTTKGKGHGVPEFVIRREVLRDLHEAGEDSSQIWLYPQGQEPSSWETDELFISRDHAEDRWKDEIEPVIL